MFCGAQEHRVGVPEHVRGDALGLQATGSRRLRWRCVWSSSSATAVSGLRWPPRRVGNSGSFGSPWRSRSHSRRTATVSAVSVAQRSLRPFPIDADVRAGAQADVADAQADELGDA